MTIGNRSGAAHDGTRSRGGAPDGAQAGSAGSADPARAAAQRAPEAPAAWPGRPEAAEAAEAADGDVAAAGAETSEEAPFWDLSPAEDPADDPPGGFRWERVTDMSSPDSLSGELAADRAEPAKPEWKPVVTPVEEAAGASPGIGQHRGNLAHLAVNPRMRVWQWRVLVAAAIMVAFSLWISWQLGLTLAVLVVIADTIYRSRKNYSRQPKMTGAQRRTRRQLNKLGRAGYRALHSSAIPDSEDQIDHLVVGPAGVFAIDSEAWDKHLIVRTKKGTQLWHGPFSMKDRLMHAQWEAQRAGDLLSGEIGKTVSVRPAMAVYGPRIPWDVATIRDVDVFSGPRLRKYLRRRVKASGVRLLSDAEIERIYKAADRAFPHLSSGSPAS
jgi:Nuclease-related domain